MRLFGNNIKSSREARGLTQEDLAERLGVSVNSISRYECGRMLPRLDTAVLLAHELCVSLDLLIGNGPDVARRRPVELPRVARKIVRDLPATPAPVLGAMRAVQRIGASSLDPASIDHAVAP